jgi:molybdopterin synthase sulfur carrier subunit
MMSHFRIPGTLRSLSGGAATVDVKAADLRSAIEELDQQHPGFKGRLLDEQGDLRPFVNLFKNDEDVRQAQGLDTPLGEGDEIAIVPAVAGG